MLEDVAHIIIQPPSLKSEQFDTRRSSLRNTYYFLVRRVPLPIQGRMVRQTCATLWGDNRHPSVVHMDLAGRRRAELVAPITATKSSGSVISRRDTLHRHPRFYATPTATDLQLQIFCIIETKLWKRIERLFVGQ